MIEAVLRPFQAELDAERIHSCGLCGVLVYKVNYAIRDIVWPESAMRWLWRHVVGHLTGGFFRKEKIIVIPICARCTFHLMDRNLAGQS